MAPEPFWLSYLIALAMLLHFYALAFWGFTDNPYGTRQKAWINAGDDLAFLVMGLIGFCMVAFGLVLFQDGRISATLERRRMAIEKEEMRKQREEYIRRFGADT